MRKILFAIATLASFALQAPAAHAVTTFDWSYFDLFDPNVTGSGQFTANQISGSQYEVTGISGTANGYTITGLNYAFPIFVPPDQQFFFGPPPNFTFSGVSFNAGPLQLNFYSSSGGDCGASVNCLFWQTPVFDTFSAAAASGPGGNEPIEFTASIAATPLPGTWFMMLGGLAIFGFAAYRRKQTALARA